LVAVHTIITEVGLPTLRVVVPLIQAAIYLPPLLQGHIVSNPSSTADVLLQTGELSEHF